MQTRFRHIGLIIWLLVYMPFAQATFGQAVLCLGTDGHVALENTDSDGACHDESHLSDALDQDCIGKDHCGACLDLLPNLDQLNLSRQYQSLELAALPFLIHFPLFLSQPSRLPIFPSFKQKHIHPSVSSTVLII